MILGAGLLAVACSLSAAEGAGEAPGRRGADSGKPPQEMGRSTSTAPTDDWEAGLREAIEKARHLGFLIENPATSSEVKAQYEAAREQQVSFIEFTGQNRLDIYKAQMAVSKALVEIGEPARAMPFAIRAVALSQGEPMKESSARALRGTILQKEGDFPSAAQECERAVALDSANSAAFSCYQLTKDRARRQGKGTGPNAPTGEVGFVEVGRRPGGAEHARVGAAGFTNDNKRKAEALARQAEGKLGLGDHEAGRRLLDKAVVLDPDNPELLAARSRALLAGKDFKRASSGADASEEQRSFTERVWNHHPWGEGLQWALGIDKKDRGWRWGDGDPMTEGLKRHEAIKEAALKARRRLAKQCAAGRPSAAETVEFNLGRLGWGQSLGRFALDALVFLTGGVFGGNIEARSLGSFSGSWQATKVDCRSGKAVLRFHIKDTMSLSSFSRFPLLGYQDRPSMQDWVVSPLKTAHRENWIPGQALNDNPLGDDGPFGNKHRIIEWQEPIEFERSAAP